MSATKLPESLLRSLSALIGNILTFTTNSVERFRISINGGWGLSGTNYGTSGQVLTSAGDAPPTWTTPSAPFTFRNRIIGGDFSTNPWQRGTSFASVGNGNSNSYQADRFSVLYNTAGIVTISKSTDAPTIAQAGLFTQHSLYIDVTTVDSSIAAGDYFILRQGIEGYNIKDAGFGQSGTRNITLSFWVKSTKTGIFCVAFRNNAFDRSYIAEYTVNTTNTWELKTITIAVDTTGTWNYDTTGGLYVSFALMAGSTYQTAAGAWTAGNFFASSNQVNALDNTANDFKVALVQLEVGSAATAFEIRPIDVEATMCYRYCQKIGENAAEDQHDERLSPGFFSGTTVFFACLRFPTVMRIAPTITFNYTTIANWNVIVSTGSWTTTAIISEYVSRRGFHIRVTGTGGTSGTGGMLAITNNNTEWLIASADF